jgi:hypothetical protein
MHYTITKLDRRHSWHTHFGFMLEFKKAPDWSHKSSSGVLEFDRSRRWFNTTFGWSQDVETRGDIVKALSKNQLSDFDQEQDFNQAWAYSCRYGDYRIYVRSEQELNWFVLSHPGSSA